VLLKKVTFVKNVNKGMIKQVETVLNKLKIAEFNIKINAKIVLNNSIFLIIIVNPLFKIVKF